MWMEHRGKGELQFFATLRRQERAVIKNFCKAVCNVTHNRKNDACRLDIKRLHLMKMFSKCVHFVAGY